jgi:hypothetical protein
MGIGLVIGAGLAAIASVLVARLLARTAGAPAREAARCDDRPRAAARALRPRPDEGGSA